MIHSRLIHYFRACFESDNREQSIWNVFAKDLEHLYWLEGHKSDDYALDHPYASEANKSIEAYKREKSFLCGAYFCTGKIQTEVFQKSRSRQLCAPLLLFDAELIHESGQWRVEVITSSVRWNTGVISEIAKGDNPDMDATYYAEPHSHQAREAMGRLLQQVNPDLNLSSMADGNLNTQDMKEAMKSTELQVFPASAIFLNRRSLQTRGILHELEQMAEEDKLSSPLSALMHKQLMRPKAALPNFKKIPGLLSKAQKQAISCSASHPLSLLIGPPGTGKSYTIAAMALDRFIQGESVLIVGNNDHALDVVMDKLVEVFSISSEAIIRGGDHNYLQQLKAFIDHITLHGVEWDKQFSGEKHLVSTRRKIKNLEKRFFQGCNRAIKDGQFIKRYHIGGSKGLISKLRWYFLRNRLIKSRLLSHIFAELQQHQQHNEVLLADYINHMQKGRLHNLIKKKRQQLVNFSKAIKARTAKSQERYFSSFDYQTLLHVFPIWLVSLSKLHKVLPLKSELFDLVIFDEATQCDLTTSMPALHRAKRAVVVGDTKQLRFVSFLSKEAQSLLQEKNQLAGDEMELNYRDNSLVDYAHQAIQNQEAVNLLDEHYRSLPPLISFNNEIFYANRLRLMTAKPDIEPTLTLFVIQCQGKRQKNVNKQEGKVLLDKLAEIIEAQKDLTGTEKQSVGVLSFFRDQAEYLEKQILKNFDLNSIKQHKLRASTPYGFQGEERDIMLISCALDNESTGGSYAYLNRQDMFNVATSRARRQQILFLSADKDKIPKHNLLGQYLRYMGEWSGQKQPPPQRREFQTQVAEFFAQQGWHSHINFAVAGMDMDIMISHQGQAIAVDLLGFPDESQPAMSLSRYQLLERANLKVFPLSYGMWLLRRDEIIEQLQSLLGDSNYQALQNDELPFDHHLVTAIAHIRQRLLELSLAPELEQLNQLIEDFQSYVTVLGKKLSTSEITYVRYRQVAEEVVRAAMDNLDQIVYIHMGLNSIQDSDQMVLSMNEKAQSLYEQNQLAIGDMQKAIVQLSQLKTGVNHSELEMDEALVELRNRINQIQDYNS